MSSLQPDRPTQPTPFVQLLHRLHFYAGLFIGPFLLVAALSGVVYVLTPQIEDHMFASVLHTDSRGPQLSLARQVAAAEEVIGSEVPIMAVRPAPEPGNSTRVMFHSPAMGPSLSRAVFVDPVSGQVLGDLPVYGTSGVLPLRTWLDQFHRGLLLADVGRLYSELAASWLWLVALGGVYLWMRRRGSRRRLSRVHGTLGLILLLGLLFFSATGLTWSRLAGSNIGELRHQFGWATPSVSTQLGDGPRQPVDEHAAHHMHMGDMSMMAPAPSAALFDQVLQAARHAGISADKIEIRPAADAKSAWTVTEIDRRWPTRVDAVAIDPANLTVVDQVRFSQYPLAAKLTRWGIDAHMGILFGLANQLLLLAVGLGLACMVVLGYLMWWRRRPALGPQATLIDVWRACPPAPRLLLVPLLAAVGWFLPLFGISLLLFLMCDLLLTVVRRRR